MFIKRNYQIKDPTFEELCNSCVKTAACGFSSRVLINLQAKSFASELKHLLHSPSPWRVLVRTPSGADRIHIEEPYFYSRVKKRNLTPWPTMSRTLGYPLSSSLPQRRGPLFAPVWFPLNSRIKVYTASSVARAKHHKIRIQYRKRRTAEEADGRGVRTQWRGHVVRVVEGCSRGADFTGTKDTHARGSVHSTTARRSLADAGNFLPPHAVLLEYSEIPYSRTLERTFAWRVNATFRFSSHFDVARVISIGPKSDSHI